jgi:hypothetical protein
VKRPTRPYDKASTIPSSLMMCVYWMQLITFTHDSLAQDDAFGPFSDTAASGDDPFTFSSAAAVADPEDAGSFDDFGAFGDFQSAHGGDSALPPPTADSWSSLGSTDTTSSGSASFTGSLEEFGPGGTILAGTLKPEANAKPDQKSTLDA